jgi:hypothetical protein
LMGGDRETLIAGAHLRMARTSSWTSRDQPKQPHPKLIGAA